MLGPGFLTDPLFGRGPHSHIEIVMRAKFLHAAWICKNTTTKNQVRWTLAMGQFRAFEIPRFKCPRMFIFFHCLFSCFKADFIVFSARSANILRLSSPRKRTRVLQLSAVNYNTPKFVGPVVVDPKPLPTTKAKTPAGIMYMEVSSPRIRMNSLIFVLKVPARCSRCQGVTTTPSDL